MRIVIFDDNFTKILGSFTTTHSIPHGHKAVCEFTDRIAETFSYRTEPLPPGENVFVHPPYVKSEREEKINALCEIIENAGKYLPSDQAVLAIRAARTDLLAVIEGPARG